MWLLYIAFVFYLLIPLVVCGQDSVCGVAEVIFALIRGHVERPACCTDSRFLQCLSEEQSDRKQTTGVKI